MRPGPSFAASARRLFAAGLAALLVAGNFASLAHLLLVRHVVCPEHGELIHPDGDGLLADLHEDAFSISVADESEPAVRVRTESGSVHAHDHCLVAAVRNQRSAAQVRAAISADLSPSAPLSDPPPADLVSAQVEILQLAPKSSPPA